MGPRFTGEDFETLIYPTDGTYYQTTFAYWHQLLRTRAKQVGADLTDSPTAQPTPDTGASGITTSDRIFATPDPLANGWHLTGGR